MENCNNFLFDIKYFFLLQLVTWFTYGLIFNMIKTIINFEIM